MNETRYAYEVSIELYEVAQARRELESALADSLAEEAGEDSEAWIRERKAENDA